MPYTKKTFTKKRRPYRKKISKRKYHVRLSPQSTLQGRIGFLMPKGKSPFPQALFTKMTYFDQFNLGSTAGSFASNVFNVNSPYDPDQTGVGHQPSFYDTLLGASGGSAPYYRYNCYGAVVKLTFISSTSATGSGTCGYSIHASTVTIPSDVDEIQEQGNGVCRSITTLGSGTRSTQIFKFYISNPMIRGISKENYLAGDEFTAAYNANPSYRNCMTVFYEDIASSSSSVFCKVSITYLVKLTVLNEVAES